MPSDLAPKAAADGLEWYDAAALGIEGKGWADTQRPYDRLPGRAQLTVPEAVWSLSRHSAGMSVRFVTDSPTIAARWVLGSENLAMSHMPASGVSGLDLYTRPDGRWRWCGFGWPNNPAALKPEDVGLPAGERPCRVGATLIDGIDPAPDGREYRVYLPLYNATLSLEIGIKPGCRLLVAPPENHAPIVFYGTSIVQGGCASRPGMSHCAILGRRLDRPIINLGFSGNGRMEQAMADLIAELRASAFVLDCVPNMANDPIYERTMYMVQALRAKHPTTPVVLVEDRTLDNAPFLEGRRKQHARNRELLRRAWIDLQAAQVAGLYYIDGPPLLGNDGDATVDSSHPTDLGFARMADAMEPVLRRAMQA